DECSGRFCLFSKPFDTEVVDYYCPRFDIMAIRFTTFYPDVLFLTADSERYEGSSPKWYYQEDRWDKTDTTTLITEFDADMSCSGENCVQRFNNSLTNFSTSSEPLVKCLVIVN
ncbi:hypothetical protein PMAYCL1PPCAC_04679, partial [Pristionchus mayeri]